MNFTPPAGLIVHEALIAREELLHETALETALGVDDRMEVLTRLAQRISDCNNSSLILNWQQRDRHSRQCPGIHILLRAARCADGELPLAGWGVDIGTEIARVEYLTLGSD